VGLAPGFPATLQIGYEIVWWRSLRVHSLVHQRTIDDGRRVPVRQDRGVMNEPSRERGHRAL
jgi:hypothetical protein